MCSYVDGGYYTAIQLYVAIAINQTLRLASFICSR